MKIFLKQILAFVCAGYFLAAFSGFNIVRYCCDGCADAGIAVVAEKSCHAIHHAKQNSTTASCCTKSCEKKDVNCEILRVQTDIPVLALAKTTIHHDSNLSAEFSNTAFNFQHKYNFSTEQSVHYIPDKKVFHSGRDILTLNAVLIC